MQQQLSLPAMKPVAHGTQVMYAWAQWQKAQATPLPSRIGVFRKEDIQLVVHQYGPALCGVLRLAAVAPKVRGFREWRQPFETVHSKLTARSWTLEHDSAEVKHAHH